jgi:hypothetical protein
MKFEDLLAQSHSTAAAREHRAAHVTDETKAVLTAVGRELLADLTESTPGACVMMSALYAQRLRSKGVPAYVVAGTLSVQGVRVFGTDVPFDGKTAFSESNLDWDGHAWVVVGGHVADVSIFRTAYSKLSPPLLAEHVRGEFGLGRGLLLVAWRDAPKSGLYYAPRYVLTAAQVERLAHSAEVVFGLKPE